MSMMLLVSVLTLGGCNEKKEPLEKLDTEYLSYNTTSSAVDNILKLDSKLKSTEKKFDIASYKDRIISTYSKDIREFNLSKYIAYKKVKRA